MRWIATTVCAAGGVALLALARAMDAPWFERHMLLPWYYPWAPAALPRDFRLGTDADLVSSMAMLVDTFLTIKRFELERSHRHVPDWDLTEYAHHL